MPFFCYVFWHLFRAFYFSLGFLGCVFMNSLTCLPRPLRLRKTFSRAATSAARFSSFRMAKLCLSFIFLFLRRFPRPCLLDQSDSCALLSSEMWFTNFGAVCVCAVYVCVCAVFVYALCTHFPIYPFPHPPYSRVFVYQLGVPCTKLVGAPVNSSSKVTRI
jgi:hypothetical protein